MKIGIAGPVALEHISDLIAIGSTNLPKGYGGAPFMGTLVRTLLARGHEVSVYSTTAGLSPSRTHFETAINGRFRVYFCAARRRSFAVENGYVGRMVDFFKVERRNLLAAINDDKPDVIHAHWTYEFALAGIAAQRPCVVTVHDSPFRVLRFNPNLYRLGRMLMALRVLRTSRVLTAVSPYVATQVERIARVPLAIIPNPMPELKSSGVNVVPFVNSSPIIAMVTNGWGRLKNSAQGMAAFQKLRERIPNATLKLFGQDYGPGEFAEQYATKHQIRVGIEFIGSLPHGKLMEELKHVDILLHPSYEEACPLTLIEAMANGIPVVAGRNSGGVPWVLGYGECGLLTDISSAESMSSALFQLLGDPVLIIRLRNAGRKRSLCCFSPEVVARLYEERYIDAINRY